MSKLITIKAERCELCGTKTMKLRESLDDLRRTLVCSLCGSEEWMDDGKRVFVPKGLIWQAKRAGLLVVEREEEITE
jgi:hypothetical protein